MAHLSKRAEKDLEGLGAALQAKARSIIATLDKDPYAGKKLLGSLAGKRSVRLGRTHRIIYVTEPTLVVLTIGPRKDIYR